VPDDEPENDKPAAVPGCGAEETVEKLKTIVQNDTMKIDGLRNAQETDFNGEDGVRSCTAVATVLPTNSAWVPFYSARVEYTLQPKQDGTWYIRYHLR
jgi:hypothetical protein